MYGTTKWVWNREKFSDTGETDSVDLKPFDMMYMPRGYRHKVEVTEERMSVSLVRELSNYRKIIVAI
jgi:hypothetical protein